MLALIELLVALIEAFVHLFGALLELGLQAFFLLIEFGILLITKGFSAASAKYQERKRERRNKDAAEPQTLDSSSSSSTPPEAAQVELSRSTERNISAIMGWFACCILIAGVLSSIAVAHVTRQRIEATRAQVRQLADQSASSFQDDKADDPQLGKLTDRDAWQQPIELFVDKALLGKMIVIRSAGPDQQAGTLDDILSVRFTLAKPLDIGGELAQRGAKALRVRVAKLLTKDNVDQLPKQIDMAP